MSNDPGGIVTELKPDVDFGLLSDFDIARRGMSIGVATFNKDLAYGMLNGDSLALVAGVVDDGLWQELCKQTLGPTGEEFLDNISPKTGKLATTLRYRMNSGMANQLYGNIIPEGPMRYTGAVWHTQGVETIKLGWLTRDFASAASGVQGYFDQAVAFTTVTHMAALWALKMQAMLGKP
jgi:hypothetical protein